MNYVSSHTISRGNHGKSHYTLRKIHTVYTSLLFVLFTMLLPLMVSGSMEAVEANKFLMFRSWYRIEAGSYGVIDEITDNFSLMGFGVDIHELHV